jgi:hypothetical protein
MGRLLNSEQKSSTRACHFCGDGIEFENIGQNEIYEDNQAVYTFTGGYNNYGSWL